MRRTSRVSTFSLAVSIGAWAIACPDDPVRAGLDEAKQAYRSRVGKLKSDLAARLEARIDTARKKGDRDSLAVASREKDDLESKGVLPLGLATEEQRDALRQALKALNDAFAQAVKKYVQSKQDAKADALDAEKKAFLEEFAAAVAMAKDPEGEAQDKKTARGKSRETPLDAWGRWQKFPGGDIGPRCFLWQDERGWHVRVMTNGRLRQFEGTFRVLKGKLTSLTGTDGLEPRGKTKDAVTWNDERDRITFRFLCDGNEDGFDFKVSRSATGIRCLVKLDGYDHPESIYLGTTGQHPSEAGFTLEARKPPVPLAPR